MSSDNSNAGTNLTNGTNVTLMGVQAGQNSSGTEVNTKISIQVSRLRMAMEVVIAKKMQAAR